MEDFKKILESSGMTMKGFSNRFKIPYRTVQGWKLGERECPEYLLELIKYKLGKEMEEKRMKTLDYIYGGVEEIVVGNKYYFGQLCEGDADAEELLESGAIAVYDNNGEEAICDFEIVEEDDDILNTIVKIVDVR